MRIPLALPLVLLATPALAHTGHGPETGLAAGVLHPLTGADHLLALLAVGLWSGMVRARAGLAAFLAAMVAGALAGMAGLTLTGVEPMILGSVVALGALAGLAVRLPHGAALALLALAGAVHGAAHGTEGAGFVLGMAGASAAVMASGFVLVWLLGRPAGRIGGILAAALGLGLGITA